MGDITPMNTVLLQELQRYNSLLSKIHSSLVDLKKGVKGLVVMSSELDAIFSFLVDGRVPQAWHSAYPSLKPLASWSRDLIMRIQQLTMWAEGSTPKVFWLAGFTYPTGMLTALMQTSARKNNASIDTLAWEFTIIMQEEK